MWDVFTILDIPKIAKTAGPAGGQDERRISCAAVLWKQGA